MIVHVSPDTIARARAAQQAVIKQAIDIAAGRIEHPGYLEMALTAFCVRQHSYGQPGTLDGEWLTKQLRGFNAIGVSVGEESVTIEYRHCSLPPVRSALADDIFVDVGCSVPGGVSLVDTTYRSHLDDDPFKRPAGPFHVQVTWRPASK